MRDINDYKAEIFRRSNERIARRRRTHKRVLAISLSFCFVIAAGFVIYFSDIQPKGTDLPLTDNAGSSGTAFTSVQITYTANGALSEKSISDIQQITKLYCTILELYNEDLLVSGTGGIKTGENNSGNNGSQEETNEQSEITIEFILPNGEKSVFVLNNNSLFDKQSLRRKYLSPEQLEEFLALTEFSE